MIETTIARLLEAAQEAAKTMDDDDRPIRTVSYLSKPVPEDWSENWSEEEEESHT